MSVKDESVVSSIRHAIDNTNVNVEINHNIVKIAATFPDEFGNQLPKSFVVDYLLVFENVISMGTEITIKSDQVGINKTINVNKNYKYVWLYKDFLGETRPFLESTFSEQEYELQFIFDQTINVYIFTGELANFPLAHAVLYNKPYGLFELSSAKLFELIKPVTTNEKFIVQYDDYTRQINNAKIKIKDGQYAKMGFIFDENTNETYAYVSHRDNVFNVSIDLVMSKDGIRNYIELLRDIARQL